MLQNTKLFDSLLNVNRSFAERLVNAIKKIAANLRNFFKENPLEAKTEYGQALLEAMNKVENRVQELWDKAVAEGIRAENKESGGVKNDNRNSSSSFNEYSVSSAIWEALDHADKHHDNLIKVGQMPRYIQSLLGISGEFYVQRNHTYENTVKKEQAISEGRYDEHAHYHGFGVDKMTNAIMSIEHPVMTINDTKDNENPTVVMILDVKGNNDTPIYAAFSFYTNRPINGKFNVKPHIVLTIAEREWFEGEGRDKSYEEIIRDAIKYKKVIDFDAKKETSCQ